MLFGNPSFLMKQWSCMGLNHEAFCHHEGQGMEYKGKSGLKNSLEDKEWKKHCVWCFKAWSSWKQPDFNISCLWQLSRTIFLGTLVTIHGFAQRSPWDSTGPNAACFFMFVEKWHARESPGASFTLILLNIWMGLQMSTEIGAVSKGPATVCAGKWLFP